MAITKKVIYTRSSEYRTIAATGAWGGPSPAGEVIFDLFVERFSLPEEESLVVDETTGTALPQGPIQTPVLRESQIGVVLRPDVAYTIGRWLIDNAQRAGHRPPEDDKGSTP